MANKGYIYRYIEYNKLLLRLCIIPFLVLHYLSHFAMQEVLYVRQEQKKHRITSPCISRWDASANTLNEAVGLHSLGRLLS